MEFGILGPLQAVRDGTMLPLGGPRQRAVLARLLLDPGRVVPVDVLIDDVWGGNPPDTATKTLQKYVSELRKSLGPQVVQTSGRGYSIDVDVGTVDARRFEQLLTAGDYDGALALWRGEALADVPDVLFAAAERSRLKELRQVAVERRLESELRSGRHVEAIPVLVELTEQCPTREQLCGLLMLALYRSGRQVEALQAFQKHRRRLADEVGLDPAQDLINLERAILRHDPSLNPPPTAEQSPTRHNGNVRLPVSLFVGRDDERRRIVDALPGNPLVTLVGPGGVGKTRLAMEVAYRLAPSYAGGVWLIDLAALADPNLIAHHVAVTLGIGDQPGQDDEQTILAALEHRAPHVLLFDNCEHLIQHCAFLVDRIVRTCRDTRVLATSRHPLGVDGERVVPIAPLQHDDAQLLFVDRATAAGATMQDAVSAEVGAICRSLDGLPLALELAAGQVRALGPSEVAARIDERLRFVSRRFDALNRHRTLRDMVAWSHDLVPAATQRVFARLSVFATTMTLDAAASVGGEDDPLEHIATLVDHSLLIREPGASGAPRFRLLDTLRLFAQEKLFATGEVEQAQRAHAEFHLRFVADAGARLCGPAEGAWVDRIEVEEPNLHAALAWAAKRDRILALRLAVALWPYWDVQSRERHAVRYFTSVIGGEDPHVPAGLRGWARTAMAELAANAGEARLATRWADEATVLFRSEGDERGLAAALLASGSACCNAGSLDAAERALAEGLQLAQRLGEATLIPRGLHFQSSVAIRRGDHRRAEQLSRQELAAWQALGSLRRQAGARRHIAVALQHQGDLEQAKLLLDEALVVWHDVGDSAAIAHGQTTLADIARVAGDLDGALRLYRQASVEFRAIGDRRCTASTYKNLAAISAARGDHARSTTHFIEAIRLRHELGDYAGLAECFEGLAGNATAEGRDDDAERLLVAAKGARQDMRSAPGLRSSLDEVVAGLVDLDLRTSVDQGAT
jgi:predicted ATPase/DNA-binding SARP family transcriptional activator